MLLVLNGLHSLDTDWELHLDCLLICKVHVMNCQLSLHVCLFSVSMSYVRWRAMQAV